MFPSANSLDTINMMADKLNGIWEEHDGTCHWAVLEDDDGVGQLLLLLSKDATAISDLERLINAYVKRDPVIIEMLEKEN